MDASAKATIAAQVAPYVVIAVATGVGYVLKLVAAWFIAHTKSIQLQTAITRVTDAVVTSVAEVEQTTVKALKAQSPDGRLSPAGEKAALNAAMDSIKNHLGDGIKQVQAAMGSDDVMSALRSRVQATIAANNKPSAVLVVPSGAVPTVSAAIGTIGLDAIAALHRAASKSR